MGNLSGKDQYGDYKITGVGSNSQVRRPPFKTSASQVTNILAIAFYTQGNTYVTTSYSNPSHNNDNTYKYLNRAHPQFQ